MNKNNFDAPKGGEPSAEFPGVVRTAEDWKKLEERFNLETDRPGDVEAEAEEEMTPEQLEAEWLADKTEYYSYQNKQKLQESLHYLEGELHRIANEPDSSEKRETVNSWTKEISLIKKLISEKE